MLNDEESDPCEGMGALVWMFLALAITAGALAAFLMCNA
jgi:hypothetical protein